MLHVRRCLDMAWMGGASSRPGIGSAWAKMVSPGGVGVYMYCGQRVEGRVMLKRSFSRSTRLPLMCETFVPPTVPREMRHFWQFSYLIGLRM